MKQFWIAGLALILLGILILDGIVLAQSSPNFDLSWNMLSGGGGERESANYRVQDSLGQWTGGSASSANAQVEAGFWYGIEQGAPTPATTSSPTPSPTATLTPSSTPTSTHTRTPDPSQAGDAYESDDTCAQASPVSVSGAVQHHTFHDQADKDWVRFDTVAGAAYLIEAQAPSGSPADLILELYGQCDGLPQGGQGYAFSPGVRLEFTAPTAGPIFLKLVNRDPSIAGSSVAYDLSVRGLSTEPEPGALILVAGRIKNHDPVQPNIHHVTTNAYQTFINQGYTHDDIYYLTTDPSLPGHDAWATAGNLQKAITQWASGKVGPARALTFYFMDHGNKERLYLDKGFGEWVTPTQLDAWFTQLETARPGVRINVVIEACYSGSFIAPSATISKQGRLVITSTDAKTLAWASDRGAAFSDHFITSLATGSSLWSSFQQARGAAISRGLGQNPWLDGNGNSIANEPEDAEIASMRGFSYVGTLVGEQWPPYIVTARGPETIAGGSGAIQAEVRDDERVRRVWAVIYPPSYQPPADQEELVQEVLPSIVLNNLGGGQFGASYAGFSETGTYRVIIHAEDDSDLEALPKAIKVWNGQQLFLPVLVRQ